MESKSIFVALVGKPNVGKSSLMNIILGEKIAIENEIRATASQKKIEGRIIASMPVFIIVFLQVISPNYLNVMYETITGRFLMTAALIVTAAAFVVIERITSIEI